MQDIYLIANWKMNPPSLKEAQRLFGDVQKGITGMRLQRTIHVVACPPYSYLNSLKATNGLALGAQDCFWEKMGAYTGGISPPMLKDAGCQYVIVGHSERREYFHDDNEAVNKKMKAVLAAGMRPVLAIGEKARNSFDANGRYTNELDPVVGEQLTAALSGISAAKVKQVIVTYEPVWAISRGDASHKSATPDDVLTAILFIRKKLAAMYSRSVAERVAVLYGGSTNSKNLGGFLRDSGAQGALVGSASLKSKEFLKMIEAARDRA